MSKPRTNGKLGGKCEFAAGALLNGDWNKSGPTLGTVSALHSATRGCVQSPLRPIPAMPPMFTLGLIEFGPTQYNQVRIAPQGVQFAVSLFDDDQSPNLL